MVVAASEATIAAKGVVTTDGVSISGATLTSSYTLGITTSSGPLAGSAVSIVGLMATSV